MKMKKYDGALIAAYLILEKENKILLLRRCNTGWCDGEYSLIAGHIKQGESARQSVAREAKEEAGVVVKKEDIELIHVAHRNRTKNNNEYIDFYFRTKKWKGNFKKGSSCDKLDWYPLKSLPKNIIPVVKKILTEINKGKFYSEYGWKK